MFEIDPKLKITALKVLKKLFWNLTECYSVNDAIIRLFSLHTIIVLLDNSRMTHIWLLYIITFNSNHNIRVVCCLRIFAPFYASYLCEFRNDRNVGINALSIVYVWTMYNSRSFNITEARSNAIDSWFFLPSYVLSRISVHRSTNIISALISWRDNTFKHVNRSACVDNVTSIN